MTTKKKSSSKKSRSSTNTEKIISALDKFLLPKILSGIKEKFHHELNHVTTHIEHKIHKITKHIVHESIHLFILLMGILFFFFGLFYLVTDIFTIPRSYVLLALGFALFIIVLLFGNKRVHHK